MTSGTCNPLSKGQRLGAACRCRDRRSRRRSCCPSGRPLPTARGSRRLRRPSRSACRNTVPNRGGPPACRDGTPGCEPSSGSCTSSCGRLRSWLSCVVGMLIIEKKGWSVFPFRPGPIGVVRHVPQLARCLEVEVFLPRVRREVARVAEVLRVELHAFGKLHKRPHVLGTGACRIHAADERRTSRSTHRGVRPAVVVAETFRRELVDVRRLRRIRRRSSRAAARCLH